MKRFPKRCKIMIKKKVLFTPISTLIFGVTACGDGDDDDDNDNGKETKDSDTESEMGTDTGEADAGPRECTGPDVAIDEKFDEWDGGGSTFYMAKPTADGIVVYDDNNTMVDIADHDALYFHANTERNGDSRLDFRSQMLSAS
jgi:hypothetical protein